MKNIKFILLFATTILFISCEEVVNLDLDTEDPKLVIDASIDWVKGTPGNEQVIKLTTSTGYYEETVPTVSGATAFITNTDNGSVFDFIETVPGTGEYICTNFEPIIGNNFELTIIYNNETYTATEKMYPVSSIENITQKDDSGFSGDAIEIEAFFQDDPTAENYYLSKFSTNAIPYPEYTALDDEFSNGNLMSVLYIDDNIKSGDDLNIKLSGISRRYYNYMELVITMIEGGAGSGPFQTTPAPIRGNLINETNENNNPFGYFQLSEVDYVEYIIQ
ncbi:DUF4249 family protein [Flavobacterium litorale]|uniref:DUF4249 domain-containing protein n=1 Tax=Flavobacterium litorale TaxID=2856519 RepID=A0ABX8VAZ6_9FLAO|nr:DUF4249 family protein [Flavobacterium litorale]QYJ67796.1 DUF4249 domain-containing protein [Flavobacterium litorale]